MTRRSAGGIYALDATPLHKIAQLACKVGRVSQIGRVTGVPTRAAEPPNDSIQPMKTLRILTSGSCLAGLLPMLSPAAPVALPNGDFSSGGDAWSQVFGGGTYSYSYPASGGNPGGYGVIDNTAGDGGFGILVADDNQVTSLTSLGLSPARTYRFSHDMITDGGVGGFKVDFFSGAAMIGSTGDLFPDRIGDGTSWETYSYDVAMPSNADGIKVVLLWGAGAEVGFDNVQVDNTPLVGPSSIPNGDFEVAAGADWAQTNGGGTFTYSFPASGGNPDGYGVIDHSANDGGFGLLVTYEEELLALNDLGLAPGETYKFSLDMANLGGVPGMVGGLKVDFFNGPIGNGSTGDMFATSMGAGWNTYDFEVTIPSSATGIKLVCLWGPGGIVGYDNVVFDPAPLVTEPVTEIPNGDFEEGGANWTEVPPGGNTTWSYPDTGGNPGGYGVMTNDGAGFGIWVSNGDAPLPIEDLGLSAGQTYVFSVDMIQLSGDNLGGLKVDFFFGGTPNGSTGDKFATSMGAGWNTYDFEVTIPAGTDGIKVVPLWGSGSSVGYDNVTFDPTPVEVPNIPNGDFEDGMASWFEDGADTAFSYPSADGNPGGFGQMANTGPGGGILTANGGAPLALSAIGLAGGDLVEFTVDMRILAGMEIGGLRVDYLQGPAFLGSSGNLFPTMDGDGTSWASYTFEIELPAATDNIKINLLSGAGSTVGFDNIDFTVLPRPPFRASIAPTNIVSWTPTSATNLYQPQSSPDEAVWSDIGQPVPGDETPSTCDSGGSFYRVQEYEVTSTELVNDPGFEIGNLSWAYLGVEPPEEINEPTEAQSGDWYVRMSATSVGGDPPAPSTSIMQQILGPGSVGPGETLDFSFWANVEENVGANIFYSVKWRKTSGEVISQVDGGINTTLGTWQQVNVPGLVTPAETDQVLIEFGCVTGAVADQTGSVRIDDVSLLGVESTLLGTIPATVTHGYEISWPSEIGVNYQVYRSTNFADRAPFGDPLPGTGNTLWVCEEPTGPRAFFDVEELVP